MSDKEWIELDPSQYGSMEETERDDSVEITVGLSPYDLPDGVRGYYDNDVKRFVIEFRYLSNDEPLVPSESKEHVTLFLGKNSDRLCRIEVDIDRLKASVVDLKVVIPHEISEAIKGLSRSEKARQRILKNRFKNHRIAAKVLQNRKYDLLSSIR
jgi:hypothetical protein